MEYDVLIIGGGPAGYVAAIRAGQTGLKTALVEKAETGGMCLNWGCIPTKAIIESAKIYRRVKEAKAFGVDGLNEENITFNWQTAKNRASGIVRKLTTGVDFLLKKNGVDVIKGSAKITSSEYVTVENRNIYAKYIIIATGSYPESLLIPVNGTSVVNVDKLFSLEHIPEKVVINGNGPAAVELAQFMKLTDHEVTLVTPELGLFPGVDSVPADFITGVFKKSGVKIIEGENILSFNDGVAETENHKFNADIIINCNMRKAVLPDTYIDLRLDEKGFIKTDDNFRTNFENIYAVGDVNGRSFLAHMASAQGIHAVNHINGIQYSFNFNIYPLNMYTSPEVAQIGETSEQLDMKKIPYKVNEFPLSVNGKALAEGNTKGMIRVLSDKKYGQILGVQIVAENATDLIMEASAFMQLEATVYDLAQTIHAHPTVSEIYMEVGFDASGKAIHK